MHFPAPRPAKIEAARARALEALARGPVEEQALLRTIAVRSTPSDRDGAITPVAAKWILRDLEAEGLITGDLCRTSYDYFVSLTK